MSDSTAPPQPSGSRLRLIAKDLLAGTTGGCLGIAVSQPFDVAKVRMQTDLSRPNM